MYITFTIQKILHNVDEVTYKNDRKNWHTQVFNNELYLQNESVTRQDTNQSILEFTGLQK